MLVENEFSKREWEILSQGFSHKASKYILNLNAYFEL